MNKAETWGKSISNNWKENNRKENNWKENNTKENNTKESNNHKSPYLLGGAAVGTGLAAITRNRLRHRELIDAYERLPNLRNLGDELATIRKSVEEEEKARRKNLYKNVPKNNVKQVERITDEIMSNIRDIKGYNQHRGEAQDEYLKHLNTAWDHLEESYNAREIPIELQDEIKKNLRIKFKDYFKKDKHS